MNLINLSYFRVTGFFTRIVQIKAQSLDGIQIKTSQVILKLVLFIEFYIMRCDKLKKENNLLVNRVIWSMYQDHNIFIIYQTTGLPNYYAVMCVLFAIKVV